MIFAPAARRIRLSRIAVLALFGALWAGASAAGEPVFAQRQMAATANPLASKAALAILREGGSALDAAIAGQMVLAVVEPQSSGLGGGGLLMLWDAKAHDLVYLEGLASAPASMPTDYAHDGAGKLLNLKKLERSGRVVGVPGTLRLLATAHRRYGRLPWPRLFDEAIMLAETGFPMPPYLHSVLTARADLATKTGFSIYYDETGKPLPLDAAIRNPALAATLRHIARDGADAFYKGPVAEAIVNAVGEGDLPGAMTKADLAGYQAKRREPVCVIAFARRICSAAPPASGGIALLQQLAILDRLGIADQAPGSVEAAHRFIEASRLTMADRRSHLGDPDQIAVPVSGLLDPAYLDARAREVSVEQATKGLRAGAPPMKRADLPAPALPPSDPVAQTATTHLSIIDRDGDVVSFTTTNNLNFGSDIIAAGVVLNDAMTNFATNPIVNGQRVANAAAPTKRPITTMAPTIVFGADGQPRLIIGAGGGARIIDSVAETIVGVLAWSMDVRRAIEQPRYGAQNGGAELERGTAAAELADGLRAMGHELKIQGMNAGVQAIAITPVGLEGWGDPRRDGAAAGD